MTMRCIDELVVLDKQYERLEHVGLSLGEAKMLLLELQRQVVTRQIAAFLSTRAACPSCGRQRGVNDHKTVVFRTLFGHLQLAATVSVPARRTVVDEPLVELLVYFGGNGTLISTLRNSRWENDGPSL